MVRDPLHIRYRQMFLLLVRFGLVGMLNTAFGYAVYAVFVVAGIAASLARVAWSTSPPVGRLPFTLFLRFPLPPGDRSAVSAERAPSLS